MITNRTLPEQVSLSRQSIPLSLASNLPTDPNPVNKIRLTVTGSPSVGETLHLVYLDVSETFTVQTAADESGNTLSVQGALSLSDYAEKLVTELNKNYALYLAFEISYSEGASDFINIEPRTDRTNIWSFDDGLTGITAEIIQSSNPEYQPNPGLVVLVEKKDHLSGEYGSPIRHDLPIIASGEAVIFDLQNDFDLRHHLPPTNTIGIAGDYFNTCTDNVQEYRIRYAERSGRPSNVLGLTTAPSTYFALFGTNSFFSQYASFWSYWLTNGRFLSTQSRTKSVTYDQPEWLYWVGRQSATLTIRVEITKRSGAVSVLTRGSSYVDVGQVFAIKAGYNQLNLPDIPDDPIVSYKVELVSGSDAASEAITYKVLGNCGIQERYFLFGNSLGGCDTVRASGKFKTNLTTTAQEAERLVTNEELAQGRGQFFQYNTRGTNSYEGSVGFRSAAYIAYLQELLLSPEAWIVDTQGLRFNPILIDRGSVELLKDGEDLYTLRFGYRHAWEEKGLGVADDGQRIILPPSPGDQEVDLGG